jgi:hypothetical protein
MTQKWIGKSILCLIDRFITPKLYIVDLAGSEKVYFEQKSKISENKVISGKT